MLIGGQEFPNKCPDDCALRNDLALFGQGSLCDRCPIFNCVNDGESQLLPPEAYRPDWAKAWKEWFSTGMEGLPYLQIWKGERNDTCVGKT